MAIALTHEFAESVRQLGLLQPAELDELAGLEDRHAEPRVLARELIRRSWLTPYQVNQLSQGKGPSLILGQYVLLARIGQGGMGQVFKARHRHLGRIVALKVIRKECLAHPIVARRFLREVEAVSKLCHPNVVRAFDADEVAGTRFFAMEYVEGIDLARLVKEEGPLPIAEACEYSRQTALGLQHAHEQGMVHRDIKPSNLLVSGRGVTAHQIKILDMGLARLDRPEDVAMQTLLTQDGLVLGTPDFIAPEQARNAHTIDIRADLYSLGCTLYFLLTGRVPFTGSSFTEKVIQHQLDEARPVEELRREVPPGLAAVVRKLMAKKPEDRYGTPAELAAILESLPLTPPPGSKSALPQKATPGEVKRPGLKSGRRKVPSRIVRRSIGKMEKIRTGSKTPIAPFAFPVEPAPRQTKPVPRQRRLVRVVLALVLLFVCGAALRGLLSGAESPRPDPLPGIPKRTAVTDSAAQKAWQGIANRGRDARSNQDDVRRELLQLRMTYPGTPQARSAAELMAKLPSSLDKLDPTRMKTRYAWMPSELIAAFGKRQAQGGKRLRAVVFSPDGKHLAAGGADSFLRIWDPVESAFPEWGKGNDSAVQAAVYSPDGRELAMGGDDGKITLWDPGSPTKARSLPGHRNGVMALAYAPDGKTLASAGGDRTVRLWDPVSRKERCTLETAGARVLSLAFSPDGKNLIAGRTDGVVQVWDVGRPIPVSIAAHRKHSTWVWVTAFSPDGQTVVTGGGGDGTLRLSSWNNGKITNRAILKDHAHVVHGVAFTPDGKTLISAGQDCRVIFWDAATGKKVREWELRAPIFGLALAPDGRHLATANGSGTMFLFRLRSSSSPTLARK